MRRIFPLITSTLLLGCPPSETAVDEPLRPLLYTEAPVSANGPPTGYEPLVDPAYDPTAWPTVYSSVSPNELGADLSLIQATTPDRLMLDVFYALLDNDRARMMRHAFAPEMLATAARMGEEAAGEAAEQTRAGLDELLTAYNSGSASQRREGGLRELLEPGQIEVGRPRDIGGAQTEPELAVMHWGSELLVHVRGTNIDFALRFPNILRGSDGLWRLRRAPTMDDRFTTWRAAGFDLKPAMMQNEHAPYPVDVGNYWHYRTRRPGLGAEGGSDSTYGVLTNLGFRDEVSSVEEFVGYRIARIRRIYDNPSITSERDALLLTPLRVYDCDRECVRRREDASWVLDYAHRTTPLLVFPLIHGEGWGPGGRPQNSNRYRVGAEPEPADVPSGVYPASYAIASSTPRGRATRYVVPGVGVVLRRLESTTETHLEELIEYRILQ